MANVDESEVMKACGEAVAQYLHEEGLVLTLHTFQMESSLAYQPEGRGSGELLKSLVRQHLRNQREIQLMEERKKIRSSEMLERTMVLQPTLTLAGIHHSNVLCAKFSPQSSGMVVSGGADGKICAISFETDEPKVTSLSTKCGGVLSLMWHPRKADLFLASFMDGSHGLFAIDEAGQISQKEIHRIHDKYVCHSQWDGSGDFYLTCSYDKSACVFALREDGSGYELKKRLYFDSIADAMAFHPLENCAVIGVRESNLLEKVTVEEKGEKISQSQINLNPNKDNHVSFSVLDLQFNSSGEFLSVYTTRHRVIVYSWKTMDQIAFLDGMTNGDGYPLCRHIWDSDTNVIFATSERDNKVFGFNVFTEKVVFTLEGSKTKIRNLDINLRKNTILTCSFDHAIRLYTLRTEEGKKE